LKSRSEKLLPFGATNSKSLFASFSAEKEGLACFLRARRIAIR
jgi:hypothetical protein